MEGAARRQPTRPRAVSSTPRVFAWAPVPAAAYYLVDLYRGRTRIYESRPTEARLTLPSRWTFDGHRYRLEPGRYRWTVRVGLGRPSAERYGEAVVEATLVVPKAR